MLEWSVEWAHIESQTCYDKSCSHCAYHAFSFSPDYGVEYFKKFTLVMNALDNRGEFDIFFDILTHI